jgi:hypothetical protein
LCGQRGREHDRDGIVDTRLDLERDADPSLEMNAAAA